MQNKFPKKSKVFYINTILSLVAVVLVINMVSPRGNELIKRAVAAVTGITGEGTISKLVRFAGATNPSNFVSDSIIYDNGTNIGIGTATPAGLLHVNKIVGADTVGGNIILDRNTSANWRGGAIFSYYYNANAAGNQDTLSFGVSADTTSPLTVGKVKMVITEGGNVGIGTTGPAAVLNTKPANVTVTAIGNSVSNSSAYFESGSNTWGLAVGYEGNVGSGMVLQTVDKAQTTGGKILLNPYGGNVGIGTTAPNGKLEIVSPNLNTDGAVFGYASTDNNFAIQTYIDAGIGGGGWAGRTTYASGCCNNLALQPDVGTVSVGGTSGNYGYKFNVAGTANFTSTVTATQFVGGGAGITGVTASNADTVDGYHANAGIAGSQIVVRNPNGYINSNYFNMTADVVGSNPQYLVGEWSGDNYLRYVAPSTVTVGNATNLTGGSAQMANIRGTDQMIENNSGAYLHLGNWGVARTAADAVLVNTAYMADTAAYATTAGSAPANGGTATNSSLLYDAYRGGYHYSNDLYVSYAYNAGYAATAGSAPANGGSATYATSAGYAGYVSGGWSGNINQGVMKVNGVYTSCMVYSNGTLIAVDNRC